MSQQINLYTNELQPVKFDLNIRQLIRLCLLITILMVLLLGYKSAILLWQEHQLSSLRRQQASTLKEMANFKNTSPEYLKIMQLQAEHDKLLGQLKKNADLIREANQQKGADQNAKYSDYLRALAQSIVPHVWIRKFQIISNGEKIVVEGSATNADDAVQFMKNLTEQRVFIDKKFNLIQVDSTITPPPGKTDAVNTTLSNTSVTSAMATNTVTSAAPKNELKLASVQAPLYNFIINTQ